MTQLETRRRVTELFDELRVIHTELSAIYQKNANCSPLKRYQFQVKISGMGGTCEEAWRDAIDNLELDPKNVPIFDEIPAHDFKGRV